MYCKTGGENGNREQDLGERYNLSEEIQCQVMVKSESKNYL